MPGVKPKRKEIVADICAICSIGQKGKSNFTKEQLRELVLWVRQAKKIIADFTKSSVDKEVTNAPNQAGD